MVLCYSSKKKLIQEVGGSLGHWRPISIKLRGGTNEEEDKALDKGDSLDKSGWSWWPDPELKAEERF